MESTFLGSLELTYFVTHYIVDGSHNLFLASAYSFLSLPHELCVCVSSRGQKPISSAYAECSEAAKRVVIKADIDKPLLLGTSQHKVALISYYYDRAVETGLIGESSKTRTLTLICWVDKKASA